MSIIDSRGAAVTAEERERHQSFEIPDAEKFKSQVMAKLVQAGYSITYVAQHYGVHRTTVWRRLRAIPPGAMRRAKKIMG